MAVPTPTALVSTLPYTKFSTSVYLYIPTIASLAAPTLAEVNAGKNLTNEVMQITGFDTQVASLPAPRAGTNFTGDLPGRITPNASSIEFYLSTAGPAVDVRSIFTINQLGYIAICNEGLTVSGSMDIFPVRVGSISIPQGLEVIGTATVSFYIYKTPQVSVPIPSA